MVRVTACFVTRTCRSVAHRPAQQHARSAISLASDVRKLHPRAIATSGSPGSGGSQGKEDEVDLKFEAESKIFRAIEERNDKAAFKHLEEFLKLECITLEDCNAILKICWLKSNFKVASLVWKGMGARNIEPNHFSVLCWLGVLCRCALLDEALDVLHQLGRTMKNIQPDVAFCGVFLNGCSRIGNSSYAEKCLRYMKDKKLEEDELIYLELMKLGGKRNDLPAVQKAWNYIVKVCQPSVPSLDSYCAAVNALCLAGAFNEAVIALHEMAELVSKEQIVLISEKKPGRKSSGCKNSPGCEAKGDSGTDPKRCLGSDKLVIEELMGCGGKAPTSSMQSAVSEQMGLKNSMLEGATEVEFKAASSRYGQLLEWTRLAMLHIQQIELHNLSESEDSSQDPLFSKFEAVRILLRYSFNAVINAAVNKGDIGSAEFLFNHMRAIGIKPDIYSFNAFLRAVVRGRGLEHGFQVIQLIEGCGAQPDTFTYNAILEGFCANMDLDKAEALLDRMLESKDAYGPSTFSFNALLKASGDADDLKRTLRVFSKLVETRRVKPDHITILYLLQAFGRINAYYEKGTKESQEELSQRISAIESYMEFADVPHSVQSFNMLLAALGAEGMADEVSRRMHLAESSVDERGRPIIDTITYNTAINAFIQTKQWNAADNVFKKMILRGMKPNTDTYNILLKGCAERQDMEYAFRILRTMDAKHLVPNEWTYNILIKACCQSGDFEAALKVLEGMEGTDVTPSNITFAMLIHMASQLKRLDLLEYLVEHMHRMKIQPSITICDYVVTAYLNCNEVDDAAEAFRVLSIWMLPEGKSLAQLENVLEDGSDVELSTLELLKNALLSKGVLSKALFAARLSGFGHSYSETWNADGSPWAKRLSEQYKSWAGPT